MQTPLDNVIVIDLSVGISGGYCTKLMADGGAEVIKVESPSGDPLRRWTAQSQGLPADVDGALFQFLNASKKGIVLDPEADDDLDELRRMIASADVVVWTPGSPLADLSDFAPERLRELAPDAVIVSITPWGLSGPWVGRPCTDATLQAMSGALLTRGDPLRPPVVQGGAIVDWATGAYAAVGLLIARVKAVTTGEGDLVDVSALEAAMLTLTMYPMTWKSIAGTPMRSNRILNLPGIHRAKDGYVGFMVVTGQQWLDFCVLVDQAEWLDDESLIRMQVRWDRQHELTVAIDEWAAEHTVDEILELSDALRVPASRVGSGETVQGFDHFVARHAFVDNPGGGFTQPDVPYTFFGDVARRPFEAAPRLGEHTATVRAEAAKVRPAAAASTSQDGDASAVDRRIYPFAGMRILDLTQNWAGPIIAHPLAMYGAEVIHVESVKRPDAMRFQSLKPMTEDHWWEWAPLYQGPNTAKLDLTLDLGDPRGRELVRRLVAECDIMIENYSPRVVESFKLNHDDLLAVNPDLVMLRAPAYGISGPWRDRGGYTQTMEMASGLSWLTGYADDSPMIPNGPMDPLAGTHSTIALLLGWEFHRRTGKSLLIECPMIFGALNVAAEQVIEWTAYGNLLNRDGNRSPRAVPQGVYRTADPLPDGAPDRWVLISVETDAQWDALTEALGSPDWATDPALAGPSGRRAAHDVIDEHLSAWCAPQASEEVVETLCAAGVPAAVVLRQDESITNPQLEARGFWERVDNPVIGEATFQAYPARLRGGPDQHNRSHAPTLGEHNRQILGGLLGLSDAELDQLEADKIIGTAPAGADAKSGFQ